MRKTVLVLLGAAFIATLPSVASAKHRHHRWQPKPVTYGSENAGPRLVANALHQLVVPLEVTFAPKPEPRRYHRYRRHR